jgi:hypothetical protein
MLHIGVTLVLEFVVMSVPSLWRPLVLELVLMESFYIHLETTAAIWISIQAGVGLICSHK